MCVREREREQNVYILRGTVVDAPAKYTEKKKKKQKKHKCFRFYVVYGVCV